MVCEHVPRRKTRGPLWVSPEPHEERAEYNLGTVATVLSILLVVPAWS